MSCFNRKALAVALLLFTFFFHSAAHATYSSWGKQWNNHYQVKSYHYSYQYRNSHKYSHRQRWSSSKYYYSGRQHGGYSYWRNRQYYSQYQKKCYGYKCHYYNRNNKRPVAVSDQYFLKSGDTIDQNVINENDTKGDGETKAHIIYGSLPSGIELASDGSLTGSSDELGTFRVYYKLRDEDGDYSKAKISIHISKDVAFCPSYAEPDELHDGDSSHALWIPQISRNLKFVGEPTATRTLPSGELVISGTVADGEHEFTVSMNFSGFQDSSSNPKLELIQEAYKANGGPIDPTTWDFFQYLDGTLVGTQGPWAGTTLSFSRRGPLAQIGTGASGKNKQFGFSSWFDAQIQSTTEHLPDGFYLGQRLHGDINIDLPDECEVVRDLIAKQCSLAAEVDSFAQLPGGHALFLFNLGETNFVFKPEAQVFYYSNGDVEITGSASDSNGQGFDVELLYTMANDTGEPKLELIDSAYVDMAGPVNPASWSYFDGFSGTLTGISGDYEGVEIELAIRGSSAQIGDGANGKNITFGLSNWLTANVISGNETTGLQAGESFLGDVNIDIKDDCTIVVEPTIEALDDNYLIAPGALLDVNILDNDSFEGSGVVLVFEVFNIPEGFTLSDDGRLVGASEEEFTFTFNYNITDENGNTSSATVTVSSDTGEGLKAFDDTYTINRGESLNANILDNDRLGIPNTTLTFDPATIPFDFQLSDDGLLTGLSFEEDRTFTFEYTITDSTGATDTATVTIINLGTPPG